jgi:hypothetical protein
VLTDKTHPSLLITIKAEIHVLSFLTGSQISDWYT